MIRKIVLSILFLSLIPDSSASNNNNNDDDLVISINRSLIIGSGRDVKKVYYQLPDSDLPKVHDITLDIPEALLKNKHKSNGADPLFTKPDIEMLITGSMFQVGSEIAKILELDDNRKPMLDRIWFQRVGRGLFDLSWRRSRGNTMLEGDFEKFDNNDEPFLATRMFIVDMAKLMKPGAALFYESYRYEDENYLVDTIFRSLPQLDRAKVDAMSRLVKGNVPSRMIERACQYTDIYGHLPSMTKDEKFQYIKEVYTELLTKGGKPFFEKVEFQVVDDQAYARGVVGRPHMYYLRMTATRTTTAL